MILGGDIKDIEAWLMQTDGGEQLPANWHPPSRLPPTAEDLALSQCNPLSTNPEPSSVPPRVTEWVIPMAADHADNDHQLFFTSKLIKVPVDLLEESERSKYASAVVSDGLADCVASTDRRGIEPDRLLSSDVNGIESDDCFGVWGAGTDGLDQGAVGLHDEKIAGHSPFKHGVPTEDQNLSSMDNDDYVDEKQLMEYLRQLEMERSEELLLERTEELHLERTEKRVLEAAPDSTGSHQTNSDSNSTGARPKVRPFHIFMQRSEPLCTLQIAVDF